MLGHPKTREAMRAGLAMYFETLDDPALMEIAAQDRRGARARPLLQHPARRRARDRDQPADLDDRLPGGPEPPVPRGQARARRDLGGGARRRSRRAIRPTPASACATSTRWSGTSEWHALPGEHRRRPVAERARRSRRQGRRRAARRLRALQAPPRGRRSRSTARGGFAAPAADASGARSRDCSPHTDVFHFYFGLTLVPKSLQFPILRATGKKSVFHFLGSDIRGKTPAELAWASGPARRSSAPTTRSAGCRRRRSSRPGSTSASTRRARRPTARGPSSCTRPRAAAARAPST